MKHDDGSIIVSASVRQLANIDEGRNAEMFRGGPKQHLLSSIENLPMDKSDIIFHQDNDPKHTSKKAKKMVQKWPPQSSDFGNRREGS